MGALERFGTLSTGELLSLHARRMKRGFDLDRRRRGARQFERRREQSSLIDAVKAGNVESVRALLKQRVDVNAASPDGTTALHWAVKANSRELAQLLIAAGAKANAANRYGVTPLTLAATNGNAALAEALLKAGANPNVTVGEGRRS